MGHPDFRVRGKIFATACWPDEQWAMVKLTPEQQDAFVEAEPTMFVPVKGGWGRRGATSVQLRAANRRRLGLALETAWRNVAPRKLVAATSAGPVRKRGSKATRSPAPRR